jgi:universal stress protein E
MQTIDNILVELDDDKDAPYVLEKVQILAEASGAKVHVVRVIYEGIAELSTNVIEDSAKLKTFILEAAESALEDLVDPWRNKFPDLETATIWNSRSWEGILHTAEAVQASLIVKGASRHQKFGDVVRTPDDWNLLRHSSIPVMLVKPQAWVAQPVLLCALDVFDDSHQDINLALLKEGDALAKILGGELHVVCTYPMFEPWVGELGATTSYDDLRKSIEGDIIQRVDGIAGLAGVKFKMLHAEEGHATHAIGAVAEETGAELLLLGTHARAGVPGLLLGNTSERILHVVATDVLTMHGASS